jgi:ankyrin repeat protein
MIQKNFYSLSFKNIQLAEMSLKLKRFSRGSKGSKKLVSLCEFGDETELLAYLKKKKNLQKINQPDKKGRYPIHILVSFPGRVNMVKILLEHGHADPNVIEAQTKNSVLHFAAQNHDLELFQFLINLPNLTGEKFCVVDKLSECFYNTHIQ